MKRLNAHKTLEYEEILRYFIKDIFELTFFDIARVQAYYFNINHLDR